MPGLWHYKELDLRREILEDAARLQTAKVPHPEEKGKGRERGREKHESFIMSCLHDNGQRE